MRWNSPTKHRMGRKRGKKVEESKKKKEGRRKKRRKEEVGLGD
jgi:hypothetical protein